MAVLQLVYAPNAIFKQIAEPVTVFDDALKELVSDLFATLEFEQGVGMAATMVGINRRIAIVDLHEDGVSKPLTFINPTIAHASEEIQTHEEASLCFPYISANVSRAHKITVEYQDIEGTAQTFTAEGFLASVIQHEVDYLNGKVYLDYLSKLKRDSLMKKMQKQLKANPPHIHGPGCSH